MNFLGMGPLELLVILALALIVFGPEKLPEIGGQIGRALRDFRRTTSELSEEFHRSLQLEVEERRTGSRGSTAERSIQPPAPPARGEARLPGSDQQESDLLPPY